MRLSPHTRVWLVAIALLPLLDYGVTRVLLPGIPFRTAALMEVTLLFLFPLWGAVALTLDWWFHRYAMRRNQRQ